MYRRFQQFCGIGPSMIVCKLQYMIEYYEQAKISASQCAPKEQKQRFLCELIKLSEKKTSKIDDFRNFKMVLKDLLKLLSVDLIQEVFFINFKQKLGRSKSLKMKRRYSRLKIAFSVKKRFLVYLKSCNFFLRTFICTRVQPRVVLSICNNLLKKFFLV